MHQEREYPGRVSGSDLFNPDFAALARPMAGRRTASSHTPQFEPAFAAALAADRPTLIHLKLDTDVITTRASLTADPRRRKALRRSS